MGPHIPHDPWEFQNGRSVTSGHSKSFFLSFILFSFFSFSSKSRLCKPIVRGIDEFVSCVCGTGCVRGELIVLGIGHLRGNGRILRVTSFANLLGNTRCCELCGDIRILIKNYCIQKERNITTLQSVLLDLFICINFLIY